MLCDYGVCRKKAVKTVAEGTRKRPLCAKHVGYAVAVLAHLAEPIVLAKAASAQPKEKP